MSSLDLKHCSKFNKRGFYVKSSFRLMYVHIYYIQCFKSRDDNFSSNYFISKGQFQTHFSQLLVDLIFSHSNGGITWPLLSPMIRVSKSGINYGPRKVRLKNWPFWRKIVVSRPETLYVYISSKWESKKAFTLENNSHF